MTRTLLRRSMTALWLALIPSLAPAGEISVRVDARDGARRLLHARVEAPIPQELRGTHADMLYVEWTPGNHNPSGPIQNVVDLRASDALARPLSWRRDEVDPNLHRILTGDSDRVIVEFSYITNQPGVNSRSSDSYGFDNFGGMCWNTTLLYPAWSGKSDTIVRASLVLPAGWKWASGLRVDRVEQPDDGPTTVHFAPAPLWEVVDSPVIYGEHLRTYELGDVGGAQHFLHALAATPERTELVAERLDALQRMIRETGRVFGRAPGDRYHFLVLLDDALPGFGLEHLTSTYVSMGSERFRKAAEGPDPLTVLAHEYVHAWCGKWVAPKGLLATEYRSPAMTSLLWVYEGLASYYDEVLATRAGLQDADAFNEGLARLLASYERQAGRRWRSVEDTALAMRFLRARSDSWEDLRRRQDYYGEGSVFWLTADAVIRRASAGARSLDDVMTALLAVRDDETVGALGVAREYTREDVVAALASVHDGEDWDALIRRMIEEPRAESDGFAAPAQLGRRLTWTAEPSERARKSMNSGGGLDLALTVGARIDKDGAVTSVRFASPADEAGVRQGDRIVGIRSGTAGTGYRVWSPDTLRSAVAETGKTGGFTLLTRRGEDLADRWVPYELGLVFPALERLEAGSDTLDAILTPREPAPAESQ